MELPRVVDDCGVLRPAHLLIQERIEYQRLYLIRRIQKSILKGQASVIVDRTRVDFDVWPENMAWLAAAGYDVIRDDHDMFAFKLTPQENLQRKKAQ